MAAAEKKVATACIKRHYDETYCGRVFSTSKEFVFNDAGYAAKHYAHSTTVKACPECVDVYQHEESGVPVTSGAFATRGLEKYK